MTHFNAVLGEKVVERVIEKRDNWYPYQPYRWWGITVGDVPGAPQIYTSGATYGDNQTYTITLDGGNDALLA